MDQPFYSTSVDTPGTPCDILLRDGPCTFTRNAQPETNIYHQIEAWFASIITRHSCSKAPVPTTNEYPFQQQMFNHLVPFADWWGVFLAPHSSTLHSRRHTAYINHNCHQRQNISITTSMMKSKELKKCSAHLMLKEHSMSTATHINTKINKTNQQINKHTLRPNPCGIWHAPVDCVVKASALIAWSHSLNHR